MWYSIYRQEVKLMEEKENLVEKDAEKQPVEVETTKYPHASLQKVENEREVFWKSYKIHNTLKMIVMMICLVAIIIAFIVFPKVLSNNPSLQTGLTIVVAIAALGGTYGYSVYVRKKFDRKMKVYFDLYFNSVNDYVFGGNDFKEVELQNPGKITLDEFNECKLYKDVIEAGSRGLTKFKYKGLDMSIVDCAGNVKDEKRMRPVFVGKMLRAKASYKGENPVFVYLKGNERALPPTNMEEIKNVLEDQKMVVYSNYKDWKKVLTGPVMKAIEGIKVNKILVDLAVAIYNEKVYVMMGYDDPLMVLPLQNEFDAKPTEIYKKDMAAVVKVVEVLNQ